MGRGHWFNSSLVDLAPAALNPDLIGIGQQVATLDDKAQIENVNSTITIECQQTNLFESH